MTYKAAIAGLSLGGGKSVIWGERRDVGREPIFRAHGRAIESLGGRYITAEDVVTTPQDMQFVRMETAHVSGLPCRSGDPSPVTAYGVYRGMKACAQIAYGNDALQGRHVAVQGLGHVGYYLCEDLAQEGARLSVTDIDPARVERAVREFGAQGVDADAI
jgi:leucine dehydrogenase